MKKGDRKPPIEVDLTIKEGFASFTNARHPENRIGYRFFEHSPMTWGEVPATGAEAANSRSTWEWESGPKETPDTSLAIYRREIAAGKDGWTAQRWTYQLQPVDDGIEMLWTVETKEVGLPSFYGVQQCFRMSGRTNKEWRRRIALTPAFSEFDLWHDEGAEYPVTTLTCVVRGNRWHPLPASQETAGAATAYGSSIDRERFGGDRPETIGPYEARILFPVDCGLITRTDLAGEWVCGIYWERTTHVTDHHPADCLHAIVNIGSIPPHSRREIRGKIYWFKGSKDDLRERWESEFAATP